MKRKLIARGGWFSACLLILSLLVSLPIQAQDDGITETFDDPALPGWQHSPDVSVTEGVLRVAPGNFAAYSGDWPDFTITESFRLTGPGMLVLSYRVGEAGGYHLVIAENGLGLQREAQGQVVDLAQAPFVIPIGVWTEIGLTAIGDTHSVTVNGQQVLTFSDTGSVVLEGGIAFEALGAAASEVDYLTVTPYGEVALSAEATPTPETSQLDVTSAASTTNTYQGLLIDAHSHLPVHPEGGESYDAVADAMVRQMDEMGVTGALIYGLYADYTGGEDQAILAQARRYPDRLYPFLSGFDPNDPASVEYVRQQLQTGEWMGIGEIYIRHNAVQIAVPADNPTLLAIYDLAAQFGVPVAIHFNPDYQIDLASGEAELERALQASPNTVFLLLHYGVGFATPERLAAYPNLYVVRETIPGEPLFSPAQENLEGMSHRLLVGTDFFFNPTPDDPQGFSYADLLAMMRQDLGKLPPSQAELIGYQTIAGLLGLDDISQPSVSTSDTPSSPANLTWVRTGGPPGGLGYDIRYNFADPTVWYVTDSFAGLHISYDNGQTWEPSITGIPGQAGATGDVVPIFSVTVDPLNPQIVWAGTQNTGHIYKSTDGGRTWTQRDEGVTIQYNALSFRGFTIDPRSSDIVYAMAETTRHVPNPDETGGLIFKTTDGGGHWDVIWDGGMPSSLTRYMWIEPRNPDVLYVSTGIFDRGAIGEGELGTQPFGGLGVLESTDGGQTWRELNEANGLNLLYIGSLFMHPTNPDILLAAAGHLKQMEVAGYLESVGIMDQPSPAGVYRTTDGGEHWIHVLVVSPGLPQDIFTSVEMCVSDPNIAYAASWKSVYRSDDAGQTWTLVSGGNAAGWGASGFNSGFPIDLQCDPRDPDRLFANNYGGGNFLSEDGGHTWVIASQGYTGALTVDVAADLFYPDRVYAVGRNGTWRSNDRGAEWIPLNYYPPELVDAECLGLAVDPSWPDHVLLGCAPGETILESEDGGASWQNRGRLAPNTALAEGFFPTAGTIIFAPSDPSIVYAGTNWRGGMLMHEGGVSSSGVFVSHDSGATWQATANAQLQGSSVYGLAVDPVDAQTVFAALDTGLVKSTDGGANWARVSGLPEGIRVRAVAVNPLNSQMVLAGVDGFGIYLSTDGGNTWQESNAGLEPNGSLHEIVFDPTEPQMVYASDHSSGVYRSTDGGLTWTKINNGLSNRAATGLSISADGQHLYVATDGGGVFRLDVNGQAP